jgi:hypothetical protein
MSFGRSGITVAALTALLALSPQVAAQDASTLKKDMIGQWELATTERSKTCVVALKGDATPQGLKLELGAPVGTPAQDLAGSIARLGAMLGLAPRSGSERLAY